MQTFKLSPVHLFNSHSCSFLIDSVFRNLRYNFVFALTVVSISCLSMAPGGPLL